jgi:UDP-3-O-[3-hydroxymyristoyl] glucosamine N-acyltransferase
LTRDRTGTLNLGTLVERFGLELRGDPDTPVRGLGTLVSAGPDQLGFLANRAYADQLADCRAAAVILSADDADRFAGNCLISSNPYADWARAADLLHPPTAQPAGIHLSASIGHDTRIDPTAAVGANVSIGAGVSIGERAVVGAGSVIEDGVEIGPDSRLVARVFVGHDCRIGKRVIIHPGAVIGADGFGLAFDKDRWLKVPQLGRVVIGDDCEIGANTTIDRGAVEDTVLEEDVRLDNQVQIAHNVHIGAHTAIAGCSGVAGSTKIGRYCMIAGACGIAGHLVIGDRVVITAMSTVLDSIDQPGHYGSGIPARPHGQWKRLLVRLGQLEDWFGRLRRVEKKSTTDQDIP